MRFRSTRKIRVTTFAAVRTSLIETWALGGGGNLLQGSSIRGPRSPASLVCIKLLLGPRQQQQQQWLHLPGISSGFQRLFRVRKLDLLGLFVLRYLNVIGRRACGHGNDFIVTLSVYA